MASAADRDPRGLGGLRFRSGYCVTSVGRTPLSLFSSALCG
jgi:hypothetical protein